MKRNMLIILMSIILAGGVIMVMFFCRRNKYKDLCAYTEKLLEIEWNDCVELATGNVEIDFSEEHAYIRLDVRAGNEKEALSIVQNKFGQPIDSFVLNYQGHEFATELENSNVQYIFETFMEGKRAKTRNVRIYVVHDENDQMCLYIMG